MICGPLLGLALAILYHDVHCKLPDLGDEILLLE